MSVPSNLIGWHQPPPGRLLVLREALPEECPRDRQHGHRLRAWWCRCDCGAILDHPILTARLTMLLSRSCGCLQKQKAAASASLSPIHQRSPKVCRYSGCLRIFLGTCRQVYCSAACKRADSLVLRQGAKCAECGRPIKARKGQRFCSNRCKQRHKHPPQTKVCPICHGRFVVRGKSSWKKRYCSPDCKLIGANIAAQKRRHGDLSEQLAAAGIIISRLEESASG